MKDSRLQGESILMSDWIGKYIQKNNNELPFTFFESDTVLVPAPRSSLMKQDSLWVPERIAKALVSNGFGSQVVSCLRRITAVRKAATSTAQDRPRYTEHFDSMGVEGNFSMTENIVIVDDIVTRGATLLASANRLLDAFPSSRISGFAAMRTVTNETEFVNVIDPRIGTIKYRQVTDDTIRRP